MQIMECASKHNLAQDWKKLPTAYLEMVPSHLLLPSFSDVVQENSRGHLSQLRCQTKVSPLVLTSSPFLVKSHDDRHNWWPKVKKKKKEEGLEMSLVPNSSPRQMNCRFSFTTAFCSVLLCQHAPNVSGAAATLWLSVKKSFLLFPNAPPGIKKKLLQGCKMTNSKWTKCLLQETITASYLPWPNWQTHWNSWQPSSCLWQLKCTHQLNSKILYFPSF